MNHSGDLRAAKRLIECGGEQPRFRVGLQRSFDVRQNVDCFAVEDRFVLVGPFGVRRKMVVREARTQIEHRVEGFAAVLGKARQPGQGGRVEPIVEQKIKDRPVDERHQMTPAPPSMTRIWPVMCADASDAISKAAPLRSCGPPS